MRSVSTVHPHVPCADAADKKATVQATLASVFAGIGRARAGVRVGGMYGVPLASMREEEIARHVREMTMTPRKDGSSKRDARGRRVDDGSFPAYLRDDTHLWFPRQHGLKRFGAPAGGWGALPPRQPAESMTFVRTLDPARRQPEAARAVIAALADPAVRGATLVVPCGMGKTEVMLYVACHFGTRVLVGVHNRELGNQIVDRIAASVPGARCGWLTGKKKPKIDGCQFVVTTLKSLTMHDYDGRGLFADFGLFVVDEAHHGAASTYSRAISRVSIPMRLALTATPERLDGLERLIYMLMGDVAYQGWRDPKPVTAVMLHFDAAGRFAAPPHSSGMAQRGLAITKVSKDAERNALLLDLAAKAYARGRRTLVLSDRVEQLRSLHAAAVGSFAAGDVDGCGLFVGCSKDKPAALRARVIFATYPLAQEGLDVPELDTLVLATPRSDLRQTVGRLLRDCPDKQPLVVVDVVDPNGPFAGTVEGHRAFYRRERYVVRRVTSRVLAETGLDVFDDRADVVAPLFDDDAPPDAKTDTTERFLERARAMALADEELQEAPTKDESQ